MSEEPQVAARLGKVHVPTWDREDGDTTEEYTPTTARELAAELLAAADEADRQAAAIEAACKDGHDWNDGANWGEDDHAYTSWRCKREGCDAYRDEPGHHVDDSEHIARLLAALPPQDELGRILLDFDGHPVVTVFGRPISRDDRLDAAAMRGAMATLFRKALGTLEPAMLRPDQHRGIFSAATTTPAGEPDLPRDLERLFRTLNQRPEPAGPFGNPIHVDPNMPEGELLIVGSCACEHPITNHTQLGCGICPCVTPVGKLAAVIRDTTPPPPP